MPDTATIQVRDPFVVPIAHEGRYYLYGTTDAAMWGEGPGVGFDCWHSTDLEHWEGPIACFRRPPDFWADKQFWAPEVHERDGRYFMLATFKADGVCRGTQALASISPRGPFVPHSDGPLTPRDRECLDGTLYTDQAGHSWMVFCHEWLQIDDGAICAMRLSDDLSKAAGAPITLFHASEAPWAVARPHREHPDAQAWITDGPFLHRLPDGGLVMIWSSFSGSGYAVGQAVSESRGIEGPWRQVPEPLYAGDGGHGMLFETFEGRLMLSIHKPDTPHGAERPLFLPVAERDGILTIQKG